MTPTARRSAPHHRAATTAPRIHPPWTRSRWRWLALAAALVACHHDGGTGPYTLRAPTGLAAQATSANDVRITLDRVPGASGYVLQRASGDTNFVDVATFTGASYDDGLLDPGTTYRYRVATRMGSKQSGYSDAVSATTLGTQQARATLSGTIDDTRTLVADTIYLLHGPVKVVSGGVLRIGPGTLLMGDTTVVGSSLLVERGARIMAEGTATHPIVFTSERAPGHRHPGDWGGVTIVGNARANLATQFAQTEGPPGGTSEFLGGTNDDDDSGVFRFVRIEFAGQEVSPNLRMTALSLYAVGRKTTLDHVETVASLGDGIHWSGGTVNARYLVVYEAGDDSYDFNDGYQGSNQFLIGLQTTMLPSASGAAGAADHYFLELDNCEQGDVGCTSDAITPYTMPLIANFTAIGPGAGAWDPSRYGGYGLMLRRGTGATLVNGVVAGWPAAALTLEDSMTLVQLERDTLTLRNLLFTQNGRDFDPAGSGYGQQSRFTGDAIESSTAPIASLFAGFAIPPTTNALDWTPAAGSPLATGGLTSFPARIAARAGSFVVPTAYRGAASPSGPRWWAGWTAYVTS